MNKREIIAGVSAETGLSRVDVTRTLEAVLAGIGSALKEGDEVRLLNFGTFSVSHRVAKEARNPRTNEPVRVPASRYPKFKPGRALKRLLNS